MIGKKHIFVALMHSLPDAANSASFEPQVIRRPREAVEAVLPF